MLVDIKRVEEQWKNTDHYFYHIYLVDTSSLRKMYGKMHGVHVLLMI